MTTFEWNQDKNKKLKLERGVSFDDISKAFYEGNLVDIIDHYNKNKYPKQRIILVNIKNFIYLVPFVTKSPDKFFLKTIIPSSKYTKKLLIKK